MTTEEIKQAQAARKHPWWHWFYLKKIWGYDVNKGNLCAVSGYYCKKCKITSITNVTWEELAEDLYG